ncbi:hypothetical protein [Ktedonobacter sp. SOSP1-52]|uniref:hypothetical protein n=1 Tax=Ktedonobacter sp. SOSP1-52 TaxID=2778366 RepID=UPI0019152215|nr:hypothetical protein [Ktedonobacter sp. SOSP1-52]
MIKKFMNGLSHPWLIGIATLCTIVAIIWSVFIWFVPSPALFAGSATTPTPSVTQSVVPGSTFSPSPSPTFPPTPTLSPTPTNQTIIKNIPLACPSEDGCDSYNAPFDTTLNTIVVNQTTGSITFNYTITYRSTTLCEDEAAYITLADENGQVTSAKSGSMFEGTSLSPGQTLQQNAVILLIPVKGATYTLHTQIGCHFFSELQAISLSF